MGIPFYFRTITRQHPNLISKSCGRRVNGLYLDLNCAIHQCARDVIVKASATDTEKIETDIIRSTIEYIDKIIDFARPTKTLFVAIDGPPPRAKMVQQRKRRFVSSWRNRIAPSVECIWDRNAITPGTPFMAKMSACLTKHFDSYKITRPSLDVHFYDSDHPGEGEAKIFKHLRKRDEVNDTEADIVYGLDADLIMLSLVADAAKRRPIYLLREPAEYDIKYAGNQHAGNQPFMYFDTRSLAKLMTIDVKDYVVLCFLLGNDFIPPLSYLKINNNGIDLVIEHYKKISKIDKGLVIETENGPEINMPFLLSVIESIKSEEDERLAAADAAYYAYFPRKRPDEDQQQAAIDNYPSTHKFPNVIKPNTPGWRQRYYYHLFYRMTDSKDVDNVCANYLEGIRWTFDYYFGKNGDEETSWGWYYKYEYSPTALDVYNHMMIAPHRTSYTYDPYMPSTMKPEDATALQLLLVLPPDSFHLIRETLRCVASIEKYGFVHIYPTAFNLTTYLKKFIWECHPILPLVDLAGVAGVMKKIYRDTNVGIAGET
jgi:5'-3' exonuclease